MKAMTDLTRRIVVLLVLSLTWVLPPLPVVQATAETELLVARVQTPNYTLTDQGVEVPGYAMHGTPGAPSLPLYGFTFQLPPTGGWDLRFESNRSRIMPERVIVNAAPVPMLDLDGPTALHDQTEWLTYVPVIDQPDPAVYGVDAFYPSSPVVVGEVIIQDGQRVLPVRVFPFQYNPVTQQLRYHPDLVISVQIGADGETQAPETAQADGFYQPMALPGDGVLRVHTQERGIYRLTYDDLSSAGVEVGPDGQNPNTFAVYYKGQPVDIEVTGAADNSFDPGDLVIFYAVPYDGGRYQDYNIYHFVYGQGVAAQRMQTRAVPATAAPAAASVITRTLHVEYDRDYRSLYPRPDYADHFFDSVLYPNATNPTVTRTYDLALVEPVATAGVVQIKALIHGGYNQAANPDQSVLLRLNSHDVGSYQWEGRVDHLINVSAPASWLDSSPNRVNLVAALSQLPSLPNYWISPDWVQISYPSAANALDNRLYVEGLPAVANPVAVAGFTSQDMAVYDVRDPARPQRLIGVGIQTNGATSTVYWDETMADPTYVIATEAALLVPGAVEAIDRTGRPLSWADPNLAFDYVAIVGAERSYEGTTPLGSQMAAALQPLLSHRSAEGFNVAMVPVQDIYDEWSHGRIDPMAIRSFLSYAYFNWATPPSYVLLLGDGHYDYNKATNQTLPQLLPPYLAYVDPWLGEVPTDNLYVSVDSLADYLPDMAVGRLPVNNVADVTAFANKILTYEGINSNPDAAWQQRAVYVAGSCTDSAGNFHAFSNNGRLQWLPTAYVNDRVYYSPNNVCPDGTHSNVADLRPAVRAAFNQGAFYMQWFGHGSRVSWSGASTLTLSNFDPPQLNTNTQFPLTVDYACLTGYFVWEASSAYAAYGYPYTQSLAEVMVITPDRGSIVTVSPSGYHVGSALLTFQQGMHKMLFDERIERAGDVVDATKYFFFENSVGWHDVIDTMVFFGDPALKLRYPTGDLAGSTLEVSDETAPLGATLNYTLTVSNSSIFTTSHPAVVVDYPEALVTVVDAGGAANNGDTLTWSLPDLPANSQQVLTFSLNVTAARAPEDFNLAVPATVSSQMAPRVDLQAVTAILTAPDAVASSLELSRAWLPPGFPVTGTLSLSHDSGLPASGVVVTMTLPAELDAPTWLTADVGTPVYDPVNHHITWNADVPPSAPSTLSFRSELSESLTACASLAVDAFVVYDGATSSQTAMLYLVVPDVDCSGSVTVVDIQQVTARWGSQAGDRLYHERFDLNADDRIDVFDIAIASLAWN